MWEIKANPSSREQYQFWLKIGGGIGLPILGTMLLMNSIMRHGYKQDAKTRTSGDWTSYDALDEFEDVFDILILYSLGLLCFFFAQSKGYFYPKLLFISAFIGFLIIIILRLVVFIITMVNGFYIDRMDWVYILNSLLTVFSQVIATYPFAKYYQISRPA